VQLLSISLLAILIGYLIGSIPTAYIVVKISSRRDIRREGSGNVGALNSYEVTRKKWVGITVLLCDICKGALVVVVVSHLERSEYLIQGLSGVSAILGHNYSIWLKLHGGRGLATALGVMPLLGWIFPLVWCLLWCVTYAIRRNVLGGNVAASVVAPVVLIVLPRAWVETSIWTPTGAGNVMWLCSAVCALILVRHSDFIHGLLRPKRSTSSPVQ
jgi:glycerol-3-phosphate acyltransferase PlsY